MCLHYNNQFYWVSLGSAGDKSQICSIGVFKQDVRYIQSDIYILYISCLRLVNILYILHILPEISQDLYILHILPEIGLLYPSYVDWDCRLYIYIVVQRIVATEDRHDRRETLCLV